MLTPFRNTVFDCWCKNPGVFGKLNLLMMELASRHVTMSLSENSIRPHRLVCTGLIANLFEDTTKPDQFNDLLPASAQTKDRQNTESKM
ncbi:hypothetical protein C5H24_12070 [Xylella fastidiosa]|nr:hypothetical protein C5H24_12070 [Xylella fastidiosa]